jgi:SnoaL-like domain
MATKDTVDTYIAAWRETDPDKRRALLEKCWAESGTYVDPMSDVSGRDGLDQTIAGFHAQMPGATIVLNGAIDEHHGRLRFPWALKAADGSTPIKGIDVGQLSADGRLESILGFWDNSPSG